MFKKGAMVETVGRKALGYIESVLKVGMRGKVIVPKDKESGTVGVDFGSGGPKNGHTLDGAIKTMTGYWFYPEELKLATRSALRKTVKKKKRAS